MDPFYHKFAGIDVLLMRDDGEDFFIGVRAPNAVRNDYYFLMTKASNKMMWTFDDVFQMFNALMLQHGGFIFPDMLQAVLFVNPNKFENELLTALDIAHQRKQYKRTILAMAGYDLPPPPAHLEPSPSPKLSFAHQQHTLGG